MLKFQVRAVSTAEREKADRNPRYSPAEYVVDVIYAKTEREAMRIVTCRIREGKYPDDAQALDCEAFGEI